MQREKYGNGDFVQIFASYRRRAAYLREIASDVAYSSFAGSFACEARVIFEIEHGHILDRQYNILRRYQIPG